jgi:hypothetical protein
MSQERKGLQEIAGEDLGTLPPASQLVETLKM